MSDVNSDLHNSMHAIHRQSTRRAQRRSQQPSLRLSFAAAADEASVDEHSSSEDEDAAHVDGGALAARASSGAQALDFSAEDDEDSRALAVALARVCWETKGEDVLALHVAPLVYWTRYMVMATVFSRPQLGAVLAKVEKEAADAFGRAPAASASGRSEWELLDFGDVVVHVLTAQQREYYDLVSCRLRAGLRQCATFSWRAALVSLCHCSSTYCCFFFFAPAPCRRASTARQRSWTCPLCVRAARRRAPPGRRASRGHGRALPQSSSCCCVCRHT